MSESYTMEEIDLGSPEKDDISTDKIKPEPEEKTPKRVATFGELFSFATCKDRLLILLAVLTSVAHGASWPLLFLIFGNMTNNFVYFSSDLNIKNVTNCNTTKCDNYLIAINASSNISTDRAHTLGRGSTNVTVDISEFEDMMTEYALKYIYIGIAVFFLTYIHITFLQVACERQTYKLKKAFFKALLRENIEWYDKQQSGELTTRLADDLERIKDGLGDKIGLSIQFLSQFLAGFVIGFVRSWKLTLVMMSLTPLLAIMSGILGRLMTTYSAREQQLYASAGAVAEEVLSCIRTVTSFNGHSQEIEKYTTALEANKKLGIKKSVFAGLSVGLLFLFMFGAYGLAFWFGSKQVNDYNNSNKEDGLSPGGVLSVFFCVMAGSFALGGAAPHITAILTAKGAGGTIYSIIKDTPVIDSSNPNGHIPTGVQGHIQFRDIEFSYPTRKDVKILKKFNMEIKPGQTVALVGASGCGKSTIVNLIQRFYDPQSGEVLMDGIDIKDLNIQWLRGNIGVVSQEPVLFGISVAQNIALGKPGVSMEEIYAAAKMANAHSFISALPKGYDTLVGERGAQLSGGQKQRVAIARALVRDPKILLLDEATSALDSKSEGIVQEALDKAQEGRTTIVVAHRLSTIQNADVIYVMDKGEVVENGQHKELMEREGMYYNLVMLQTITEQEDQTEDDEAGYDDIAADGGSPTIHKLACQISRQISQAAVKRQLSVQSANGTIPVKTPNLFRPRSVVEEIEDDVPRPGFTRIFKSNINEWPFIMFGCITAVINGSTFPVFAVFFSEIIKTFGLKGHELLDKGLFWSLMFVAMGVLAFICNLIQHSAFGYSGETLTARLRSLTFKNIIRQDVEYFDNPNHSTGALTTRLATDASMVKNATGIRLAMLVQSMVSVIAGLVIAFIFGWKLALAILGGLPVMLLAGTVNARLLKRNQKRDSKLLEDAGKTASECIENIRTVQALTREPYFYKQYCDQLEKPHRESLKQAHFYGLSSAFSQGVIFLLYAGSFRFGAWLITHDGMEPDLVYR